MRKGRKMRKKSRERLDAHGLLFFESKSGFLRYVGKRSGKIPAPPAKVDGKIGEGTVHEFCCFSRIFTRIRKSPAFYFVWGGCQGGNVDILVRVRADQRIPCDPHNRTGCPASPLLNVSDSMREKTWQRSGCLAGKKFLRSRH